MLDKFKQANNLIEEAKNQNQVLDKEVLSEDSDTIVVLNDEGEVVQSAITEEEIASIKIDDTEIPTTEEAQAFADAVNENTEEALKEVEDWLTLGEYIYKNETDKEKEKTLEEIDEEINAQDLPTIELDDVAKEEKIQALSEEIVEELNSAQTMDQKVEKIVAMFTEEKEELILNNKLKDRKIAILESALEKKNEELVSIKYNDSKVTIDDERLWFMINAYKDFKDNSQDVKKVEKWWGVLIKQLNYVRPEITPTDISEIVNKKRKDRMDQIAWLTEGWDNTLSSKPIQTKTKVEKKIIDMGYII